MAPREKPIPCQNMLYLNKNEKFKGSSSYCQDYVKKPLNMVDSDDCIKSKDHLLRKTFKQAYFKDENKKISGVKVELKKKSFYSGRPLKIL